MGGMIWVESVYGKGSDFVQLPMKKVSDGKISNVEWKEMMNEREDHLLHHGKDFNCR